MPEKKKKNTGLIVACWFLFLLVMLIVFFVKKDNIVSNLQKTDFFNRVFGTTPEFVKNYPMPQEDEAVPEQFEIDLLPKTAERTQTPPDARTDTEIPAKPAAPEGVLPPNPRDDEEPSSQKPEPPAAAKRTELEKPAVPPAAASEPPRAQQMEVSLYFVVIDSDGTVSRKLFKRAMPKSNAPLTDAINALIDGPLPSEKSKNGMSLIPAGTKLLGASVKDGVATLNFNENFEFNSVGVEGYIAQLMQIVYTATEFPTVKSVQFLIEGVKKEYLGSEGQWIGSPLTRLSF
ncbi:MAG: GerMN domain-containing protein [Treponemataceae bacterium]|nr:GerMN domain-containing protein [Treponemataceae bacterium]